MTKKTPNPKPQIPNEDPVIPGQSGIQSNDSSDASQQIESLTSDLQRLQAEFINYRSRAEAEKAVMADFGKLKTIKELLPVLDDLERALAHLPEDLKDHKWAQGVQKAYDRLQKQLEKLGVTKIDALNQPFNPELHEAIHSEGEGDHAVVSEVLQNGYQMGSQIIRHSLVKVTHQ